MSGLLLHGGSGVTRTRGTGQARDCLDRRSGPAVTVRTGRWTSKKSTPVGVGASGGPTVWRQFVVIKIVVLLKRKAGLSLAEFIDHYETVHVPLATRLSTRALRYERHFLHPIPNMVEAGPSVEPEYDVVTEIWYGDLAAFDADQRDARARPEQVAAVIADEKVLFDRSKTRLALAEDRVSDLTAG
jgi:hypothetical protein